MIDPDEYDEISAATKRKEEEDERRRTEEATVPNRSQPASILTLSECPAPQGPLVFNGVSPQPMMRLAWQSSKQLSYQHHLFELGNLRIGGHKELISERVCFNHREVESTHEVTVEVTIDGQPYNQWKQEKQAFLAEYEHANFLKKFLMDRWGKKRNEILKLNAYYQAKKEKAYFDERYNEENVATENINDERLNLGWYQTIVSLKSNSLTKFKKRMTNNLKQLWDDYILGFEHEPMAPAKELTIELGHQPPTEEIPPKTIRLVKVSETTINAYWNNHPEHLPGHMVCTPLNAKQVGWHHMEFPHEETGPRPTIPYNSKTKEWVNRIVHACVNAEEKLQTKKQQFVKELNKLGNAFIKKVQEGTASVDERSFFLSTPVAQVFRQWLEDKKKSKGIDAVTWEKTLSTTQSQWHQDFNRLLHQSTLSHIEDFATRETFSDICLRKRQWFIQFGQKDHGKMDLLQKERALENYYRESCQTLRELVLAYVGGQKHTDKAIIDLLHLYQNEANELGRTYSKGYQKITSEQRGPKYQERQEKDKGLLSVISILRKYVMDELDKRLKQDDLYENVAVDKDPVPAFIQGIEQFYKKKQGLKIKQADCTDLMAQYLRLSQRLFDFKRQCQVAVNQFKKDIAYCLEEAQIEKFQEASYVDIQQYYERHRCAVEECIDNQIKEQTEQYRQQKKKEKLTSDEKRIFINKGKKLKAYWKEEFNGLYLHYYRYEIKTHSQRSWKEQLKIRQKIHQYWIAPPDSEEQQQLQAHLTQLKEGLGPMGTAAIKIDMWFTNWVYVTLLGPESKKRFLEMQKYMSEALALVTTTLVPQFKHLPRDQQVAAILQSDGMLEFNAKIRGIFLKELSLFFHPDRLNNYLDDQLDKLQKELPAPISAETKELLLKAAKEAAKREYEPVLTAWDSWKESIEDIVRQFHRCSDYHCQLLTKQTKEKVVVAMERMEYYDRWQEKTKVDLEELTTTMIGLVEAKAQKEQAEAKAAEAKAQRERAEAKAAEEKAQREQAEAKAAEAKAQREQAEAKAAEAEAEIVRLRKEIEDLKLAPSKKDAQVRQEADNVADDTPPPIVGLPTTATDRSQVGLLNRQGIFSTTSPRPSQQPALPHPANDDIGSHQPTTENPTGPVQYLVPKNNYN